MDLFAQQARNRRMTWLLMSCFVLLLLGLGLLCDLAYSPRVSVQGYPWLHLPLFTCLAMAGGTGAAAYSYFHGARMVLSSLGARELDARDLQERQLANVVEEMAIAAGVPVPRIYVLEDEDPNAFATGHAPEAASLGVTRGLLTALDRDELQAVVAHELGHIKNLDIRLMTVASVLLGAIALLGDLAVRLGTPRHGSRARGRNDQGWIVLVAVLAGLLAPLAARLVAMAVSRTREFEADRSAAEFTRNPGALASALAKLEAHAAPTQVATRGTAHMFVVDPRLSRLNEQEGPVADLFATHPPIKSRIARLNRMGYDPGAEPAPRSSFRRKKQSARGPEEAT